MKLRNILLLTALAAMAPGLRGASPVSSPEGPQGSLTGRNIALWQSHGRYYDASEDRWKWQRCRLFGTVEDLYTRSYVVPFLVPMLENAGAYVMLPRERDEQAAEIVIDPDGDFAVDGYQEHNGKRKWQDAKDTRGFGMVGTTLRDGENPFMMGGARTVKTVKAKDSKKASTASWSAPVGERGEYAVYVSYPRQEHAAKDAQYTVHTATGDRHFTVNQTMSPGTWVYLGTFPFDASKGPRKLVSLSNVSAEEGTVGADAVRLGGGMGNVARGQGENARPSGMPRWAEASRYWLQWAGMPDSVYANQENDYRDDIFCRPQWVNYMRDELGVPIDLVMAFHSDAGTTEDDSIVGTLGIYYTAKNGKYSDGRPRKLGGDLCRAIVGSVVRDARAKYDANWTQRKMRDAKYVEARVPEVPTMLLELLSHQNLADMRYGLEPQFKFDMSRAVYKGILRFLADRKLAQYIVAPLAPQSLALTELYPGRYRLSWEPQPDPLEPTATATGYIIEERVGADPDEPFHAFETLGDVMELTLDIPAGEVRSYRVTALNAGGRSFPSEVMAAGHVGHARGTVTVVNGFTRTGAPDRFVSGELAGFGLYDAGVAMGKDLSYTGAQYNFRRDDPWVTDDRPGFGASRANMELKPVWGNSFDYVATHGRAILAAGYNFDSASLAAFEEQTSVPQTVDLILGLQKEDYRGQFRAYPLGLQTRLEALTAQGTNLIVSGSYTASDAQSSPIDRTFLQTTLGIEWRTDHATVVGSVSEVASRFDVDFAGGTFPFSVAMGQRPYAVTAPDAIFPATALGATIMRYDENQTSAAVALDAAGYRAVTFGFPLEALNGKGALNVVMKQTLKFLAR